MTNIKKAVIPAAGWGLNFLPTSKATAKEMLPIVDKPIMQFVFEEAKAAGIEEFLIISGGHKRSIQDQFDSNFELEDNLRSKGKDALLKIALETTQSNVYYVNQPYPDGLGNAILQAKDFINEEPFLVILADNLLKPPMEVIPTLLEKYDKYQVPLVAVQSTGEIENIESYGVLETGDKKEDNICQITSFVEKPDAEDVKEGSYASIGRYVLTPDIFDYLESQEPNEKGLVELTDAISRMNEDQEVLAVEFDGWRFDVGSVEGYVEANIWYGLEHEETKDELKDYIIKLGKELEAKQAENN